MKEVKCHVCSRSLKNHSHFCFDGDYICSNAVCIHRYILQKPNMEPLKKKEIVRILMSHMVRESSRYVID